MSEGGNSLAAIRARHQSPGLAWPAPPHRGPWAPVLWAGLLAPRLAPGRAEGPSRPVTAGGERSEGPGRPGCPRSCSSGHEWPGALGGGSVQCQGPSPETPLPGQWSLFGAQPAECHGELGVQHSRLCLPSRAQASLPPAGPVRLGEGPSQSRPPLVTEAVPTSVTLVALITCDSPVERSLLITVHSLLPSQVPGSCVLGAPGQAPVRTGGAHGRPRAPPWPELPGGRCPA